MRQSNVVFRLRDYLKREQANLERYLKKDVKNDRAAKVWDEKNLELDSILNELIDELEQEAAQALKNWEVLEKLDREIEKVIMWNPEVSIIMIQMRLNDRNGHSSFLNLERYGSL
jgi:predicted transcriptional regulator